VFGGFVARVGANVESNFTTSVNRLSSFEQVIAGAGPPICGIPVATLLEQSM
jgi:hypothetical protein